MLLPLTQETMGELIILLLLIISCARIFFIHDARTDPIATLPTVSLVLSCLFIISWGLSLQSFIVLVLSFSVFLWNFRALLRLNDNLIVDHYGVLFILSSLINLLLLLPAFAFIVYFRPVPVNLQKYGVLKTQSAYSRLSDGNFDDEERLFEKKTAFFSRYTSADGEKTGQTILFMPSECAASSLYEPFLVKLARDGNTVYAADFYGKSFCRDGKTPYWKPFRRATFCYMRLRKPDEYKAWEESEKADYFIEMAHSLLSLVAKESTGPVVLVGDSIPPQVFLGIQKDILPVCATVDIATLKDNPAPGWGLVEHTDPLLATVLKLRRDASLYTANHLAVELETSIAKSLAP